MPEVDYQSVANPLILEELQQALQDPNSANNRVYVAAAKFITRGEEILSEIESRTSSKNRKTAIQTTMSILRGLQDGNEALEYMRNKNEMLERKEGQTIQILFQEFMSLLLEFQQAMVAAAGGDQIEIVVSYTDPKTGENVLGILHDEVAAMTMDVASRGAGISARIIATKRILNDLLSSGVLEQISGQGKLQNIDEEGLFLAFSESMGRFIYSGKKRLVMWLLDKWYVSKVSAKGDLNEALAAYYLADQAPPSFRTRNWEILVGNFIWGDETGEPRGEFNPRSVAAVDNTSGVFQGDYENYQIKSFRASFATLKQFMVYAKSILKEPAAAAQENVMKIKEKLEGEGGVVRNTLINENVEKTALDLIEDGGESLSKAAKNELKHFQVHLPI